jgi:nitroreductase
MLLDKMQWRYATKKMDASKAVPQDKVNRIIEAARLAPTSSGLQPFEIVLVTNPEVRAQIQAAAHGQDWLQNLKKVRRPLNEFVTELK